MERNSEEEPVNILVVDDLPEKRLVYQSVLASLGENVILVESGPEALRQVLQHQFAVILLDVNMPDMDGFETARLIRAHRRSSATPLIFLTAFADDIRTAEGYATGAVDYLPTPVMPEILRAKVRVFVELFRLRRRIVLQAEEQARRISTEESNRRLQFSSNTCSILGRSLEFDTTVRDLVRLPVPFLADLCTFHCSAQARFGRRDYVARWDAASDDVQFEELTAETQLPELAHEAAHAALASGEEVQLPRPVKRAQQEPVQALALPVQARGRTFGILTLHRDSRPEGLSPQDITQAQTFLSRAAIALDNALLHEELQKADRQKNDFLSMLAHELRNPLAPIRSAVQLVQLNLPEDPDLQWAAEVIDRQVTQMVRLVDDLLDVSRVTTGKIRLRRQPEQLAGIVQLAVEASQPLIDERGHQLTVILPAQPVWIDGDQARLTQVLTNLLNNAAKYTDEGGQIWLTLRQQDDAAEIVVRDNGIGIPPDQIDSVFDAFTQIDRTIDRATDGLGIGLTLVQHLVAMHGGTVNAFSEGSGQGAEFTVKLPLLTAAAAPTAQNDGDITQSQTGLMPTKTSKVLVVDDNVDSAATMARLLRLEGHRVRVAYDGPSGLEAARHFEPNVVLLDIGLPGMDGYTVAGRLREDDRTRHVLLIAVSGYGQAADELRSQQAGFDFHMVKPVEFGSLRSMLPA